MCNHRLRISTSSGRVTTVAGSIWNTIPVKHFEAVGRGLIARAAVHEFLMTVRAGAQHIPGRHDAVAIEINGLMSHCDSAAWTYDGPSLQMWRPIEERKDKKVNG